MADRLLRLLDHPLLARVQTALFVGTVVVPALALLVAGVVVVVIQVATSVSWELLIAPTIALFLLLWWLFAELYRRRGSRDSQISVEVNTVVAAPNEAGHAVFQLYVRVHNAADPTRLSRWELSAVAEDGSSRQAHHVGEREPFSGRPVQPPLARETSRHPLAMGEEREGLVWFMFTHTAVPVALAFRDPTLRVRDERGRTASTTIDVEGLRAVGEERGVPNRRQRRAGRRKR